MPPMQLRMLVLPAPLGPISASSSPARTANDTPASTRSPPKASDRRSTPSAASAIPAPAAAVLLDVAVAPARSAGPAQVELADVLMREQACRRAVQHDAAVLHHVGVIGGVERDLRVLLDEQDRHAERAADGGQAHHQLLDHHRSQPERQLV